MRDPAVAGMGGMGRLGLAAESPGSRGEPSRKGPRVTRQVGRASVRGLFELRPTQKRVWGWGVEFWQREQHLQKL